MLSESELRRAADWLLSYRKREAREVVRRAEEALEKRFIFRDRWDMEKTTEYVSFSGDLDFTYQPGDDPEWVYAFNRLIFLNKAAEAYWLTGEPRFVTFWVETLRHFLLTVPEGAHGSEKSWRTIETGIRLGNISYGYMLLGERDEVKAFYDDLMRLVIMHGDSLIRRAWDPYHLMSNWGILANHGLFVASQVFDNKAWAEESYHRLEMELMNQIYDDGSDWEQSPMYHNEVLRDLLDVILYAPMTRFKVDPMFQERVREVALLNLKWIEPDGTEPMMGDSDDIDLRDMLSRSALVFNSPEMKYVGEKRLDWGTVWLKGVKGAKAYENIIARKPEREDFFLPDSGNVYMRTGWKKKDSYVRFHNGTLGAGHGHADQGHVSIVSHGKDFLVDAGRYTYVPGPGRYDFKGHRAHNTVIYDDKRLYPEKDSWECHELGKAINTRASFLENRRIAATEGAHLGYVKDGIVLNRRVLFLKNEDLVVVNDEVYGRGEGKLEALWHFAENLDVALEGDSALTKRGNLHFLSSSKVELKEFQSERSRHYNEKESNAGLSVKFSKPALWCVIDLKGEKDLKCYRLEVRSNFKDKVFSDEEIEAIAIVGDERDLVIVSSHLEYASPTDTYLTGGCIGFGSFVVFNRKKGEFDIGTRLFT